jgi:hypothetical protein
MTPDILFSLANGLALAGWIILAAGIALDRPFLRDRLAGALLPLALSLAYCLLLARFWWQAPGGFGSLAGVQALFTSPWIALAGWIHYLAFDLAIGAHLARRMGVAGWPRLAVIAVLPLAFLFGPVGYLVAQLLVIVRRGELS